MSTWQYFGEFPIDLGGLFYQSGLPCRAVNIKEIDPRTVQIQVLKILSWEPLSTEPLSSETLDHSDLDLEEYIKRRYLHD